MANDDRDDGGTETEETPEEVPRRQPPRPSTILACLVRQAGRVRITAHEVSQLHPQAKLDVRMTENGDCMLTYREPAEE